MREKELSTQVFFIRHGKTDFPLDRIYCDDREDPPLSPEGEIQVAATAKFLAGVKLAAIYTSPTRRTSDTARSIAATHGLTPEPVSALRERHFGVWEGLFFHEIERDFPDAYNRWKRDNAAFKPDGGESVYDLLQRLSAWLAKIIPVHAGRPIAIISHVGPIRTAIAAAVELPMEHYRRLTIGYASISQVNYGRKQNNLISLNVSAAPGQADRLIDG